MKPESADYLAKARECLDAAKRIQAISLAPVAARESYLAIYHAAQAFVFECTGKPVKSHNGMRSRFAELTRDNAHFDRAFGPLLGRAYKFKEISDYGIGSSVTPNEAQEVIDLAQRFIDHITELLPSGVSHPRGPDIQP